MSEFLSETEAREIAEAGHWRHMTIRERALMQMFCERLVMPFGEFSKAVGEVIGTAPPPAMAWALMITELRRAVLAALENRPAIQLQGLTEADIDAISGLCSYAFDTASGVSTSEHRRAVANAETVSAALDRYTEDEE